MQNKVLHSTHLRRTQDGRQLTCNPRQKVWVLTLKLHSTESDQDSHRRPPPQEPHSCSSDLLPEIPRKINKYKDIIYAYTLLGTQLSFATPFLEITPAISCKSKIQIPGWLQKNKLRTKVQNQIIDMSFPIFNPLLASCQYLRTII